MGIRTCEDIEEFEEYIRNEFNERGFEDVEEWLEFF